MAFLGVTGSAGGGGSELWLLGLSGGFWQAAGGLVRVREALDWAEEGCGGSWQVWWILDRSGGRCLWWSVRAVMGLKV